MITGLGNGASQNPAYRPSPAFFLFVDGYEACRPKNGDVTESRRLGRLVREGRTMPQATKTTNVPRLVTLLLALVGCLVVAVPVVFPLNEPTP